MLQRCVGQRVSAESIGQLMMKFSAKVFQSCSLHANFTAQTVEQIELWQTGQNACAAWASHANCMASGDEFNN
jgi:hypothetical protein